MSHIKSTMRSIDTIQEHPKNYNTHDAAQITELQGSLEQFGQYKNIIIWKDYCIAGNGLLQAARQRGDKRVEVKDYSHLSEDEALALLIADNATPAGSKADLTKLSPLLSALSGMTIPGVTPEWKTLVGVTPPVLIPPDEPITIPEEDGYEYDDSDSDQTPAITQPGEIVQLGRHILMCGDATDPTLPGRVNLSQSQSQKAALVFTSPPYNVGKSSSALTGNTHITDNFYQEEYTDEQDAAAYATLLSKFFEAWQPMAHTTMINIQWVAMNKRIIINWLHKYQDKFADMLIWDKINAQPAMARKVTNSQFETILTFTDDATRAIGTKDFRGTVSNVFTSQPQRGNAWSHIHAATFPIALPHHFISHFTNPGDTVIDPFGGTGTTLMAAEQLGRTAIIVEISPKYCDAIRDRWERRTPSS